MDYPEFADNLWLSISAFFCQLLPSKRDNLKQLGTKLLYIVTLGALLVSSIFFSIHFALENNERKATEEIRLIWNNQGLSAEDKLKWICDENSDFRAWITIDGTDVDNPVYQAEDNKFYLNHNNQKKKNEAGALFFDYRDTPQELDRNLVIYGNSPLDGSLFSSLKSYRNLSFYKEHPVITLSVDCKDKKYKIFSVFVLNSKPEDDDGKLFNVAKNSFPNFSTFNTWIEEAIERSILTTNVQVDYGDNILTLVTDCNDFEGARLVVMARQARTSSENIYDASAAVFNGSPRYPKRWYTERGLKYPY